MTEKELRRLNRKELLEIMLSQAETIEELREELSAVKNKQEKSARGYSEIGSLAESALSVSGIYEDAQTAADRYLAEIKEMRSRAEAEHDEIIRKATEDAGKIIAYANQKADEKMKSVNEYVEYINAQTKKFYREHPEIREYIRNQQGAGKN